MYFEEGKEERGGGERGCIIALVTPAPAISTFAQPQSGEAGRRGEERKKTKTETETETKIFQVRQIYLVQSLLVIQMSPKSLLGQTQP